MQLTEAQLRLAETIQTNKTAGLCDFESAGLWLEAQQTRDPHSVCKLILGSAAFYVGQLTACRSGLPFLCQVLDLL